MMMMMMMMVTKAATCSSCDGQEEEEDEAAGSLPKDAGTSLLRTPCAEKAMVRASSKVEDVHSGA